jgi:hypothetical protein
MRARGLILVGLAGLAACGGGDKADSQSTSGGADTATANADRVSCAIAGASAFTDACTLERTQVEGAPILVIRHPDGGFRRFALKDGSVVEADGADAAKVTRNGTAIDIAVGSDRYRLSAGQLDNAR